MPLSPRDRRPEDLAENERGGGERGALSSYLLVLVRSYGDELSFLEHEGAKVAVGQAHQLVGSHQVEARLVFVHRVEDGLLRENSGGFKNANSNGGDVRKRNFLKNAKKTFEINN